MKRFFGGDSRGAYTAVSLSEKVYEGTTEPAPESLSPTETVFTKVLGGRLSGGTGANRKWVLTTMLCGLCAITLGSVIVAVDPYQIIFRLKVTFAEGAETFMIWKKPEVDLLLKVYLFNVTNRDEFMAGKEKLKVQQVGPYVYKEDIEHSNVSFNDNGTITAVPLHPLRYLPELSNGTEKDLLILPNIALLSITQVQSEASFFTRMGLNLLVRQSGAEPLVEMTAREFMFGYRSTLLTLGNKFLPSWISFDKLGLIDRMYDFDGDISTTFSGVDDVRKSGVLDTYNRLPTLPQWEFPCNNLTGASDGTKFPSLIRKDQELLFFRKSLCRSMNLVRKGEAVIKGIHAYCYVFKNHSMDNGEVDATNKCFCLNKDRCMLPGLLDVNRCYYGFPIALSYPHFMDVDQRAFEKVEGLHPDPKLHSSHFMINEDSGLPLEVSVRMQINMVFGDLSGMAKVGRFSNMVLPMLWTDISMPGLPTGMAWRFYFYLTVGPIVQALTTYLLLVGGVAFILLSLASAALIPKLSIVSSNRGRQRSQEPPVLKPANKRGPGGSTPSNNNKEMELYYCSLLAVQDQEC